jgi:hypothetical protein
MDIFHTRVFTLGIRGLTELTGFFHKAIIDGITNGVGLVSCCIREKLNMWEEGEFIFFMLCICFFYSFLSLNSSYLRVFCLNNYSISSPSYLLIPSFYLLPLLFS